MCPLCITTAVLSAAGATSGAGVIAVVVANGVRCAVGGAVIDRARLVAP